MTEKDAKQIIDNIVELLKNCNDIELLYLIQSMLICPKS